MQLTGAHQRQHRTLQVSALTAKGNERRFIDVQQDRGVRLGRIVECSRLASGDFIEFADSDERQLAPRSPPAILQRDPELANDKG
jgi:hypothetical protein